MSKKVWGIELIALSLLLLAIIQLGDWDVPIWRKMLFWLTVPAYGWVKVWMGETIHKAKNTR